MVQELSCCQTDTQTDTTENNMTVAAQLEIISPVVNIVRLITDITCDF